MNCYEVFLESRLRVAKLFDHFRFKCKGNKQILAKSMEVAKNVYPVNIKRGGHILGDLFF